jgi:predicted dehydrogenase
MKSVQPKTRRQFVAFGAAAAATATLGTRARTQTVSPSEKTTVGVIGNGGRGGLLTARLLENPKAHITAVCDINKDNLDRAAGVIQKQQGGDAPVKHLDFRALIDDDGIDAVVVATPHHWHCPIAVRALDAGKNVYVEKPASHVFNEGRLLVEAAKRNGRIVQQGTQMRSSEITKRAGEVLASGVLGEIVQTKAWGVEPRRFRDPVPDGPVPAGLDWDTWLGPAPKRPYNELRHRTWNNYRDYGNGEIGGDGIHDIDMALWGLGARTHPVQITSQGSLVHVKGETEFPDNMMVTFLYGDGRSLIYENRNFAAYTMHGYDNGNVFYGTDGYMLFSRRGYFETFLGADDKPGPKMIGDPKNTQPGNYAHVANFIEAVRGEAEIHTGAEIAHLGCGICHLGEVAYRAKKTLEFDPAAETITNDDDANAMLTKNYRDPFGFDA